MHRSGKLFFKTSGQKSFIGKVFLWFKHRTHSTMLKNFACGTDLALIADVLIWPLFYKHARLLMQNHLLLHLCARSDALLFKSEIAGGLYLVGCKPVLTLKVSSSVTLPGQHGRSFLQTSKIRNKRIGWCRISAFLCKRKWSCSAS